MWTIPEGGLVAPVNTPDTRVRGVEAENIFNANNIFMQVPAHDDKCTIVKCHPLAEGVVASVGQDHLVKVSCDWLTLVSVLSCDWSDLVAVRDAALQPRLLLQPGVLRGLVTRQVRAGNTNS